MSTVRLCDKCNVIFSENQEGWTSASGSRRVRNTNTGAMMTQEIALDYCPRCSDLMAGGNIPEEPRVPPVVGRYDERYTRQLEREAGLANPERTRADSVRGDVVSGPGDYYGS